MREKENDEIEVKGNQLFLPLAISSLGKTLALMVKVPVRKLEFSVA